MLINAGVTHPNALWLERLREGGRLVVPFTISMTPTIGQGIMAKIVRRGSRFSAHVVTPLMILSCSGLRDAEGEERLKNAMRAGRLMKLKSVRMDAHEPEETCLVHGSGVCLSEGEAGAK
jgi:protein-L-isoaspartate(D-aspartate) O-methyltransferase